MMTALIERQLTQAERQGRERLDFLRDILRASRAGFLKFCLFLPFARHRASLPPDAYYVARLVAVMNEDCGPCVQTVIDFAAQAGVAPEIVRAVVERRPESLPRELADVCRFAEGIAANDGSAVHLSETLRARYGDSGMVDLAFGIATGRVFPTIKRVLGYGQSCSITPFRI